MAREVPGRIGLPLLGETIPFLKDIIGFIETRMKRHGAMFQTYLFGSRTVVACSYDSATAVLTHGDASHSGGSLEAGEAFGQFLKELYPRPNLLLCPDDAATRSTQLLMVQCCLQNVEHFSDRAGTHTAAVVRRVVERAQRSNNGWAEMRLYECFKGVVERAVTGALLGELPEHEYALVRRLCSEHFNGVAAVPVAVSALGARSARAAAKDAYVQLTDVLLRLVDASLRRTDSGGDSAVAALADMVREGTGSREDAVQVLLTLLSTAVAKAVASAATTATATLAEQRHSALQEAVVEELRGGESDTLQGVILEALRLYPPLAGTLRSARADTTVSELRVRGGSSVWLSLLHANRDEGTFKGACIFDARRWRRDKLPMPLSFGAGKRLCKGRDVAYKMLNAMLGAVLTAIQVQGPPLESVTLRYLPVLRPAHDRPVLARPRST
ncbi:Cytochrome P450 90A1 [Gracilariopsis chorda]|uniref:Cytochrome P450 90A1 n=1 Tax=Gracilariopsis chorda TaxID=448386 RepID=A0A2V3IHK9_9FLOR|nr:Cytochrome P450 90A1 [Gracilariopsis chorda]|eukprot:PXF41576.1 Cytochrome P450 90A1 [Gracilariopsis chorda]